MKLSAKEEFAFPNPYYSDMYGMTLRDFFAAIAMHALVERLPAYAEGSISDRAYAQAEYTYTVLIAVKKCLIVLKKITIHQMHILLTSHVRNVLKDARSKDHQLI
jgi:hypothetical protein